MPLCGWNEYREPMSSETCKIDRVVETYGLDETGDGRSLDERLLARWTGSDDRPAEGYRTLTEWFNKRLLRNVYDEHGRDSLGGRVESDYDALTSDDELVATEVAESLRADGIDAESVRQDLVSWGTMRTHLKECLDGEKDVSPSESGWERDAVAKARSFAAEKAESALSSLASKGVVADADTAAIEVGIHVSCPECPTRVPFDVALERGYVCERHRDAGPAGDTDTTDLTVSDDTDPTVSDDTDPTVSDDTDRSPLSNDAE